eukprot:scaffold17992_cov90-Isochrysis_galbana.AAC.1
MSTYYKRGGGMGCAEYGLACFKGEKRSEERGGQTGRERGKGPDWGNHPGRFVFGASTHQPAEPPAAVYCRRRLSPPPPHLFKKAVAWFLEGGNPMETG